MFTAVELTSCEGYVHRLGCTPPTTHPCDGWHPSSQPTRGARSLRSGPRSTTSLFCISTSRPSELSVRRTVPIRDGRLHFGATLSDGILVVSLYQHRVQFLTLTFLSFFFLNYPKSPVPCKNPSLSPLVVFACLCCLMSDAESEENERDEEELRRDIQMGARMLRRKAKGISSEVQGTRKQREEDQ